MKKSMFAWPLGAARPGGPSKSTSIRGWIRGATSSVKSSVPVGTSMAVALEEASNKANQAHSAGFLLVIGSPRYDAALITSTCAVQCARRQRERDVVKDWNYRCGGELSVGRPTRRTRSLKRGSERRGSNNGSTLSQTIRSLRSSKDRSR